MKTSNVDRQLTNIQRNTIGLSLLFAVSALKTKYILQRYLIEFIAVQHTLHGFKRFSAALKYLLQHTIM